jgi:hypothetical protein
MGHDNNPYAPQVYHKLAPSKETDNDNDRLDQSVIYGQVVLHRTMPFMTLYHDEFSDRDRGDHEGIVFRKGETA